MNTRIASLLFFLLLFGAASRAQTISGVINNYASVTTISGAGISVTTTNSAAAFFPGDRVLLIQMKGATIDQSNTSAFGDILSMGGAGTYEFATVSTVSGSLITLSAAPTNTYNAASGYVQLVRVPRFCSPVVSGTLSCGSWSTATKTGGVLAFEAGTLTLNGIIDVSEKGFNGGNFQTGSFNCNDGNFAGIAGFAGGQKGESISAYIASLNGLKGKQANGGGGSNTGNSGGGGGGNAGYGGLGGNQYSDCDSAGVDDRGIGGLSLSQTLLTLFMGGGGGGGFRDNGLTATKGGNGGGIIYIRANAIVAGNGTINANGGNVTIFSDAEGAGGGGAGGTIFLECNNITGNLSVLANGGFGGSNNNSTFVTFCHGPGGGGGGGVFAFSGASLPSNITYSAAGGAAGTVNNPASSCYNTTFGAAPGSDGLSLPGLTATPLTFNAAPDLSVTPASTICKGESTTLTASGADYYHWNTGSPNTTIAVTPTATSMYTVTGAGSTNSSCQAFVSTTVTVVSCTGITALTAGINGLNVYPNPTSGQVFLETQNTIDLEVCDALGRTILQQSLQKGEHRLDMSQLNAGVYILKASNTAGTQLMKLIKVN